MSASITAAALPPRARRPAIALCPTARVRLAPAPIARDWLLDAEEPRTDAATLANDEHDTLAVYLWQTTRSRYRWDHGSDEVVTVIEGECFVADDDGTAAERRLGVGDVAFFPAGSRSLWRVPDRLRKVSTLVRPLPRPAARLLRALRRARRALRGR